MINENRKKLQTIKAKCENILSTYESSISSDRAEWGNPIIQSQIPVCLSGYEKIADIQENIHQLALDETILESARAILCKLATKNEVVVRKMLLENEFTEDEIEAKISLILSRQISDKEVKEIIEMELIHGSK